MHVPDRPFVLAFAFSLAPLAAQTATASLSALTPLSVQVQEGAHSQQATRPSGPLGTQGQLYASLPLASQSSGSLTWNVVPDAGALVTCSLTGNVSTAQLRSGPQEFLVQFTATAVVPAFVEVYRSSSVTAGVAWPSVQLDLDNNGTIDVPDVPSGYSNFPVPPTFGVQPVFVRVILDAALQGVGESMTTLQVVVAPQNDLQIDRVALACASAPMVVNPVFLDRGIDATIFIPPVPLVFVLGLQAQPLLLPPVGTVPCLLMPSPDILSFTAGGGIHVPLPAALRPVTFWLQAVMMSGPDLVTTDAYRIDAF